MAATVQTIFDLFRYYNCARVTIYFIPFCANPSLAPGENEAIWKII